jgi:hypothetical protein
VEGGPCGVVSKGRMVIAVEVIAAAYSNYYTKVKIH